LLASSLASASAASASGAPSRTHATAAKRPVEGDARGERIDPGEVPVLRSPGVAKVVMQKLYLVVHSLISYSRREMNLVYVKRVTLSYKHT
jgi:hypothetical protein